MTCGHINANCFELSHFSFNKFKEICLENKWLLGKYVVFVHGDIEAIGNNERDLVKQVYQKYGNIVMRCGKITSKSEVCIIE